MTDTTYATPSDLDPSQWPGNGEGTGWDNAAADATHRRDRLIALIEKYVPDCCQKLDLKLAAMQYGEACKNESGRFVMRAYRGRWPRDLCEREREADGDDGGVFEALNGRR